MPDEAAKVSGLMFDGDAPSLPIAAEKHRVDLSMFLLAFSVWAILSGASLLAPGSVFDESPVYSVLKALPISEDVWGGIMTADGLALAAVSAFSSRRFLMIQMGAWLPALRAGVVLATGALWFFIGFELLLGGAAAHFLSVGGAWDVCGGTGCLVAMAQMGKDA